jgi:hypothetical protein
MEELDSTVVVDAVTVAGTSVTLCANPAVDNNIITKTIIILIVFEVVFAVVLILVNVTLFVHDKSMATSLAPERTSVTSFKTR